MGKYEVFVNSNDVIKYQKDVFIFHGLIAYWPPDGEINYITN